MDGAFWSAPAPARRHAPFQALFAGRLEAEKGVEALLAAWARVDDAGSALVMLGDGPLRKAAVAAGAVVPAGPLAPAEVRAHYAGSDVVVVPSIPTRDFLEPWGLVVNEAFHRGVPVVATTAVGAVAGGLARHERTALVVAPGDPDALAAALRRLRDDPALRARLGAAAREAVAAYSHDAWAAGMQRALAPRAHRAATTDATRRRPEAAASLPGPWSASPWPSCSPCCSSPPRPRPRSGSRSSATARTAR